MSEHTDYSEQLTKSFRFQNRELLDNYVILSVTNTQGIIKHVSTNLCNIFKYKSSDLLDKPYSFLIRKDFINTFNNQFNDCQVSKSIWKGEIKHASQNDVTIWTDTIITPLFNDDNEHLGFILASSDITKEKKLQKINEENILKKKHDSTVLDFMPSLSSAVLLRTSSGLHKILWIIAFTVIFLLVWAGMSKIDDIVKTQGKIITTKNVQTISSLNGGVLKELFVKEGDNVTKDQKILKISDMDFKTEFDKNRLTRLTLLAKMQRLEAQANNTKIKNNDEVMQSNPELMQHEIELLSSNNKKLKTSINILQEQLKQRKNDLNDAYKGLKIAKKNHALIIQEMKIKKPLVEERIISKVDLLQLQRKLNDVNSELKTLRTSIHSFKSSMQEINNSIEETRDTFRLTAQDELVTIYNEVQRTKQDIDYLEQKMSDTVILSPSDGIINTINIKTKGEAISPGAVIAQIIPDSKYLLAQVKISPAEIGFLYIGQKVRLKLRAFDFSLYGAIESKISYISADTHIDDKDPKKEVYIVHIQSEQQYVGENKNLLVKPGMTVDADIITGKKSILDYILKPIIKSLDK
ncbi:MAG: HlyD family type I secretion periplasmic adaptor subunit [Campylobacterota bacterium]|nr:HlyD family type I secretion periplasmic adaptor subunit [Campylobacterota bacterium]